MPAPPHGARPPAEGGRVHLARRRPIPSAPTHVQFAAGRSHQSQRRCAREAQRAAERTVDALRDQLAASRRISSAADAVPPANHRLRGYQGSRHSGGALVLNASLSGLAENIGKRLESMSVREQRVGAPSSLDRVARRSAEHDRHAAAGPDDHEARDGAPDGRHPGAAAACLGSRSRTRIPDPGPRIPDPDRSRIPRGVLPRPRRVQVPGLRGPIPGIPRRHSRAPGVVRAALRGKGRRARRRLWQGRISRPPHLATHHRAGYRSQSRDGGNVPRPRPRRDRS